MSTDRLEEAFLQLAEEADLDAAAGTPAQLEACSSYSRVVRAMEEVPALKKALNRRMQIANFGSTASPLFIADKLLMDWRGLLKFALITEDQREQALRERVRALVVALDSETVDVTSTAFLLVGSPLVQETFEVLEGIEVRIGPVTVDDALFIMKSRPSWIRRFLGSMARVQVAAAGTSRIITDPRAPVSEGRKPDGRQLASLAGLYSRATRLLNPVHVRAGLFRVGRPLHPLATDVGGDVTEYGVTGLRQQSLTLQNLMGHSLDRPKAGPAVPLGPHRERIHAFAEGINAVAAARQAQRMQHRDADLQLAVELMFGGGCAHDVAAREMLETLFDYTDTERVTEELTKLKHSRDGALHPHSRKDIEESVGNNLVEKLLRYRITEPRTDAFGGLKGRLPRRPSWLD